MKFVAIFVLVVVAVLGTRLAWPRETTPKACVDYVQSSQNVLADYQEAQMEATANSEPPILPDDINERRAEVSTEAAECR